MPTDNVFGTMTAEEQIGANKSMTPERKKILNDVYGTGEEGEKERDYALSMIEAINADYELREQPSDIFNGLPYSTAYAENRRKGINYAPPRNPKDDRQVSMGLIHEKIIAFVGVYLKYAWKRRVKCFDEKGRLIRNMGDALDLMVELSYQLEKMVAKILPIFWETMTQGNAYVMDDWQVHLIPNKKAYRLDPKTGERVEVDPDSMDYTYEFLEGLTYEDDVPTQVRKAVSVLLDGRQVILVNPECSDLQEQERITIEMSLPRCVAASLFGSLKRWQYVPETPEGIKNMVNDGAKTLFDVARVKKPKETVILHLTWQKYVNTFNIFLNGTMMLPRQTTMAVFYPRMNYPLSNVACERLSNSAYARCIPAKMKFNADYVDWTLKMLAEAFEQGVYPAVFSKGKFTLTRKMFSAGNVTHGFSRNDFEFANEHRAQNGVKPSEFSFAQLMKDIIEAQSLSASSSGEVESQATATAVATADSKTVDKLGYILDGLTMGMMEMAERRIETIESKYATPVRKTLVNGKEVNVYQNFSVNAYGYENNLILDEGVGSMTADETQKMQDRLFKSSFDDRTKRRIKSKNLLIDPILMRKRKYTYVVSYEPEQKKNTQAQMGMFWAEVKELMSSFNVNKDVLQDEYLEISGRPDNLFLSGDLAKLAEEEKAATQQGAVPMPFQPKKPNLQAIQTRRA